MFKKICKKYRPIRNYANLSNAEFKYQIDQLSPIQPARILICGSSGKGKTNLLLSLLFEHLQFTRLYVNCKDEFEFKYELLRSILNKVKEKEKSEDFFWFNSTSEGIINVDSLDKRHKNLIVFDDFVTEKAAQDKINSLFVRGRKKNATVIYLTQSYFNTPKIIRLQCNYKIFFRNTDNREMNHIFGNEGGCLNKQTFIQLFQEATKEPYSFFLIDNETDNRNLQFRKNLDNSYMWS